VIDSWNEMAMHILLLDGNIESSRQLVRFFQEASYETVVAASLSQARTAMMRQSFDVVVLETQLMDGSGMKFCSELREQAGDNLVIIFLTADNTVAHKVSSLELGADDYISKPYHANECIARIEAHLRRRLTLPNRRTFLPQNS
jgi:DNA-binding response OmpR family regulator